jgi:hypothetical protein
MCFMHKTTLCVKPRKEPKKGPDMDQDLELSCIHFSKWNHRTALATNRPGICWLVLAVGSLRPTNLGRHHHGSVLPLETRA